MSLEIDDVEFWVKEALKSEKVYDLELFHHSERVESSNFQADLMFVTAKGIKTDETEVTYELLVKMGKQNKELREKFPLRIIYEREVYVYSTVVPEFKKFEQEKGLEPFDLTPKCYGTFLTKDPNQEVVVMENITKLGYRLHDKLNCFDEDHIKLTLKAYAHWHALSLALRHQKPNKFCEMFDNLACPFKEYLTNSNYKNSSNIVNFTLDILRNKNEDKLFEAFQDKVQGGILTDLLNALITSEKDESAVFVHGDCLRDNFMIIYGDDGTPDKVAMLDFQMSTLSSPAWDVAYHLYCALPTEEFNRINEYLKLYHTFLSTKLESLGCDASRIFPFSKLIKHWKDFSIIGCWLSLIYQFVLFKKSESAEAKQNISRNVVATLNHWLFFERK